MVNLVPNPSGGFTNTQCEDLTVFDNSITDYEDDDDDFQPLLYLIIETPMQLLKLGIYIFFICIALFAFGNSWAIRSIQNSAVCTIGR